MRVFIWQSFCSNNSGAFHLVARFGCPQLATEVAAELREFFAAHDESEDQQLSEAMYELAIKYDFEWPDSELPWLEGWSDDISRVDTDGDRVLIYNDYCLGLDGLLPYLEARGVDETCGGYGEPRLAVLFRLAESPSVKEALATLQSIFEKREPGESFWWHVEQSGGFYGPFRHQQIDAIKAALQNEAFCSYRLLLGDSAIKDKLRIMADCPCCPQCAGTLVLFEAGPSVPEDQAVCPDCGGMYQLPALARTSPVGRLDSAPLVAVQALDDGAIAADAFGAVWRWSERLWENLRPGERYERVFSMLRRRNGDFILSGYSAHLQVSKDKGRTWSELAGPGTRHIQAIAETPGGILLCWSGDRIHRSEDNGLTWKAIKVRGQTPVSSIAAASNTLLYATRTNGQILRSDDGGESWEVQWPAKNHRLHHVIALSRAPNGRAVHALALGEKGLLLTSVDGQNWSEASGTAAEDIHEVIQDPGDRDRLYAVNDAGELLRSADRGLSWRATKTGVHDPLRSLCLTSGGEVIAVGDYGAAVVIRL